MPKAKRAVTTRRTNPIRGAAAGNSKSAATTVEVGTDVLETKPAAAKGKAKAKTTALKKGAPAKKPSAADKAPKVQSSPEAEEDPLTAVLSVLEDHRMTPADLLLAIIQGSPHDRYGEFKLLQDELYYPYGSSKLDAILNALAVAKHGRVVLKEWIRDSEFGGEIVEKIMDRAMNGGEETEDEDEECGHCCM